MLLCLTWKESQSLFLQTEMGEMLLCFITLYVDKTVETEPKNYSFFVSYIVGWKNSVFLK